MIHRNPLVHFTALGVLTLLLGGFLVYAAWGIAAAVVVAVLVLFLGAVILGVCAAVAIVGAGVRIGTPRY